MDSPKRSYWHTAPRTALRNLSNGQSASIRGSSPFDRHKTPTKESRGPLSASAKRINLSIRREISKSHGDLSNLRPKSPPIQNLPAGLHGLQLSPGNYIDDTDHSFSPSYNRQARQAIPDDWMAGASGGQPSLTTAGSASAAHQMYRSPLHGMRDSHHIEAEPARIPIQGLTSGYIQPLDFCVPVTRSHPGDEDQRREALHGDTGRKLAVEHINISTAWNGLSDVDANELFRVHRAFVSTLEKMLANELWQIYQQLQQQDSAGNIGPIHTLFSRGIVRGISFCRDQLLSETAEALYLSEENKAKAKSGFLRLYLIATDVLVQHHEDGPRDTSITVRVRCDPFSPRPYPVVDAAWVPDSLVFERLDEFPLEGQSFSIVPRYHTKSAFRRTHFPKNVKYSIESDPRCSPLSWLVWDEETAGFEGIVPFYSEIHCYDRHLITAGRNPSEKVFTVLKIVVQAVLVDDNGSSIRYERILRARLTIKVLPWYANDNIRETKDRPNIPKAYHDTRLASADQCFALPGPERSPLTPGQTSSRLSQPSKTTQMYKPKDYVQAGQDRFRKDYSGMSLSGMTATGVGLKETDLPSLAQVQAYLVAKCAALTREVKNFEEQVVMSGPFGEHHNRTQHLRAPEPRDFTNDDEHRSPRHHTAHIGSNGSPVPLISLYASEHLTPPSSPSLHGRDATFQLGHTPRFAVLPPPAIGLETRPTLDSQTFNDGNPLGSTRTGGDPTSGPSAASQSAVPEGELMTPEKPSNHESRPPWPLPDHASILINRTDTARSSPRKNVEALSTPPMVKDEPATASASGKSARKRRAKSSLDAVSPSQSFKEAGKRPKQEIGAHSEEPGRNTPTLSDSEDEERPTPTQPSNGIFYNSFGPLRNLTSSPTLVGEDVLGLHASSRATPTKFSQNLKHCHDDLDCNQGIPDTDTDESANKTSSVSSSLGDGAIVVESVPSKSNFPTWKGQVGPCQNRSVCFSPRHTSASSISDSCSSSSDTEFIVEQDPPAGHMSRREQAKLWKSLTWSKSDKGDQPGLGEQEVRLSEDEKKAMNEAMQRSLDDLTEGFDDIFLEDSSASHSSDEL